MYFGIFTNAPPFIANTVIMPQLGRSIECIRTLVVLWASSNLMDLNILKKQGECVLCLLPLPYIKDVITTSSIRSTISEDWLSVIADGPNHHPDDFDLATNSFCAWQ
jgi:hypothetical protein